jgi:HEAT repeat protein
MAKKLGILLGLLLLVGLAVLFDPTRVLIGGLRFERFYDARPTSYWEQGLLNKAPGRSTNTAKQLADGGEAAVPVLMDILRRNRDGGGPAVELRLSAAQILGQIGPRADAAVPALLETLHDADPQVRATAALSLGRIGTRIDEVVPALAKMLARPGDRISALKGIFQLRGKAKDAIPAIVEVMRKDADGEARWHAAEALAKMGPAAQPALPQLIEALNDEVPAVRSHAAESLGRIGPEAKSSLPALRGLVNDPDAEVRAEAGRAIKAIGGT